MQHNNPTDTIKTEQNPLNEKEITTLIAEYKENILEKFVSKLKEDKLVSTYLNYFHDDAKPEDIADELIESMLSGNPMLKNDPKLMLLLNKYTIVTAFQDTLNSDGTDKFNGLISKLKESLEVFLLDQDPTDVEFIENLARQLNQEESINLQANNLGLLQLFRNRLSLSSFTSWLVPESARRYLTLFTPIDKTEDPQYKPELTFVKK